MALDNYELLEVTENWPPGQGNYIELRAPTGKVVIGGGYRVYAVSGSTPPVITESVPADVDENGICHAWGVLGFNTSTTETLTIVVRATCVTI